MLKQSNTHHLSEPCLTDCQNNFADQGRYEDPNICKSVRLNLDRKDRICAEREEVKRKLSFLNPYQSSIHSLVLVGSTAYNAQTANSDIDIVIITTTKGHEQVCSFLFEKEIDESLNGETGSNIEFTILSSEHVKKLYQISSPFAYSIRHGVVIEDDGLLLLLRNKRYPLLPQKEYYTDCLYEKIATPYFGLLKKLQKEAREKGCTLSCCRKDKGCQGLLSGQLFAKLVMQMLYVTLPSRGMIPLTKADVVTYAKMAYGPQGGDVAKHAVSLMQEKCSSFCFDEFKLLREFAVQQYKEILNIAGLSRKVRDIIVDAARIAKKDFHSIGNPSMKNCVL